MRENHETPNLRVLLIEDSPEQRQYYREILQHHSPTTYQFLESELGEEGLVLYHREKPDCVLLDYHLPDMDGLEFLEHASDTLSRITQPVIMLTSQGDERVAVEAMKRGAADYLSKGQIDGVLLDRTIQRAIREKQFEHQIHQYMFDLERAHAEVREQAAELTRLNGRLQASEQQLRALNANKDRFFSIISHDLINPTGLLVNLAENLHDEFDQLGRDELKKLIGVLHRSARYAYNLLENLLRWSRIQMGRVDFSPAEIHLDTTLAGTVRLLADAAANKGIHLNVNTAGASAVLADPDMVRLVIRNLVTNAIKFTHPGRHITVLAHDAGPYVSVSVSDTGIGMSPRNVAQLFQIEQGFKRNGTANEKGTGLGLILCKAFVERNGGTLTVESAEGAGTTFQFTLPKAADGTLQM